MDMDFDILWKIGHAIVTGNDPYAISSSFYPPAAAYFLAIIGIFPREIAFAVLTLGNLSSLFYMRVNKALPFRSLAWVLYTPLIYALGVGQLDLLFLTFFYLTDRPGWISVVAAGLLTLKPQLAFVALPWLLFRWLLHDKKKLLAWIATCLALHLFPLIFDPTIYTRWINAVTQVAVGYTDTTPGLFSLARLGIPLWGIWILTIPLIVLGIIAGKAESLVAQSLALPFGYWYNLVLLAGYLPWKILVPISWVAFYLSYFVLHAFFPMTIIPLSSAIWLLYRRHTLGKPVAPEGNAAAP